MVMLCSVCLARVHSHPEDSLRFMDAGAEGVNRACTGLHELALLFSYTGDIITSDPLPD